MVSRKRDHSEMEAAPEQQSKEPSLLERLRNCWEFACLMQYIFTFGKVVKIDEDFGIEVCCMMHLCAGTWSMRRAITPPSDIRLCPLHGVDSYSMIVAQTDAFSIAGFGDGMPQAWPVGETP